MYFTSLPDVSMRLARESSSQRSSRLPIPLIGSMTGGVLTRKANRVSFTRTRPLKPLILLLPDNYRTTYRKVLNQTEPLVAIPHFITRILSFNKSILKDYSELDSFVIYVCVEGMIRVECGSSLETLKKGEVLLIPAIAGKVILSPTMESVILEVFIS